MRIKLSVVALTIAVTLLVSGCGPGEQTLTESGSTTVLPVAEALAAAYMKENPTIRINTQGGGSSVGIKSVSNGTADIGGASRDLKPSEDDLGVIAHEIAKDALAVVVHPDNPITDLSTEQLRAIFSGEVRDWSQFGGDGPITVVIREEGSGTRDAFQELVLGDAKNRDDAVSLGSNGAIRTAVSGNTNSIGYLGLGYIDQSVKPIHVDAIEPSDENATSGKYPLVRSLYFVTKGEPEGLTKKFIDFTLSSAGQKVVIAEGFLAVK